jgi:DsbC/DsbD-like thiol-disulfide interchange protein
MNVAQSGRDSVLSPTRGGPTVAIMRPIPILAVLLFATHASANDQVRIELLADVAAVQPGKPFTLGVKLTIKEPWHVYWTNPGDSGEPTTADWVVPPGFDKSATRYPTPVRLEQPGDIVSNVYEKTVLLTTIVTPPETIDEKSLEFGVDVSWLACENTCIPGTARATLTLPVGEAKASADASLFTGSEASLPKADAGDAADVSINADHVLAGGGSLVVTVVTPTDAGLPKLAVFPPAFEDGFARVEPLLGRGRQFKITFKPYSDHTLPVGKHVLVIGYDTPAGERRGIEVPFEIAASDAVPKESK